MTATPSRQTQRLRQSDEETFWKHLETVQVSSFPPLKGGNMETRSSVFEDSKQMNPRAFQKAFPTPLERHPCALCGAPSTVQAMFTPDELCEPLYGAPAGKIRSIYYGLCAKCESKGPDYVLPQVEAAAMEDVGRNIWN
jgi:hypothetical protein